tara:strand:- start:6310 stop:6525 length:216 start_codon:yes stop_codon:yes gene_type:complete
MTTEDKVERFQRDALAAQVAAWKSDSELLEWIMGFYNGYDCRVGLLWHRFRGECSFRDFCRAQFAKEKEGK